MQTCEIVGGAAVVVVGDGTSPSKAKICITDSLASPALELPPTT
jgi:hypothetical protein